MPVAKKKPVVVSTPAPSVLAEAEVQSVTDSAHALLVAFTAIVGRVSLLPTSPCPQTLLRVRLMVDRLIDFFKKAAASIDAALLQHHAAGGQFDAGKIAVTFPVKAGVRRPSWKDEACRLAAELAALRGEEFNKDRFIHLVQEAAPVSAASTSVELVESV